MIFLIINLKLAELCVGNIVELETEYGDEFYDNFYCTEGNIGPFCEDCDFEGNIWKNGSFAHVSRFEC